MKSMRAKWLSVFVLIVMAPALVRALRYWDVDIPELLFWDVTEHAKGRTEARRDLAEGKLCLRSYGYGGLWLHKYHELAREKLGIEFQHVADCIVPEDVQERSDGYNEVMMQEIDYRFGLGALTKIRKIAEAAYTAEFQAREAAAERKP